MWACTSKNESWKYVKFDCHFLMEQERRGSTNLHILLVSVVNFVGFLIILFFLFLFERSCIQFVKCDCEFFLNRLFMFYFHRPLIYLFILNTW